MERAEPKERRSTGIGEQGESEGDQKCRSSVQHLDQTARLGREPLADDAGRAPHQSVGRVFGKQYFTMSVGPHAERILTRER
jgi:hypothetical protein